MSETPKEPSRLKRAVTWYGYVSDILTPQRITILLGAAVTDKDGVASVGVISGASVKVLTLKDVASFSEGVGLVINAAAYPITRDYIAQAHAAGLKVHGWTFAQADATLSAAEYRKYLDMGMDGMFANYPDLGVAARNSFVKGR